MYSLYACVIDYIIPLTGPSLIIILALILHPVSLVFFNRTLLPSYKSLSKIITKANTLLYCSRIMEKFGRQIVCDLSTKLYCLYYKLQSICLPHAQIFLPPSFPAIRHICD